MRKRTRRSPARFLAPLALIVFVIALMAIVSNSGSGKGGSSGSSATTTTSATAPTKSSKTTSAKKKHKAGTTTTSGSSSYTVQVGDTLGSIAAKTGVSLATIQSLNPDVDPHAMVAGQKIKLK
jgi:LysM repeat protein